MGRTVVVANNTRHNQIIAVLNDDLIDVKLLKFAGKFRVDDIATSIWCMTLCLFTLRAAWMQEVEQRMEQLPRAIAKPIKYKQTQSIQ